MGSTGRVGAQDSPCGVHEAYQNYRQLNPNQPTVCPNPTIPAVVNFQPVVIPVVIRYLYTGRLTASQKEAIARTVNEQMETLNADFSGNNPRRSELLTHAIWGGVLGGDTRISFCLSKKDSLGQPFDGIDFIKVTSSAIENGDIAHTIHLPGTLPIGEWSGLCNFFLADNATVNGMTMGGYTYLPYCNTGAPSRSIFCTKKYFKKGASILTHEVGHWLGLEHTWGQGDRLTSNDCQDDDYVTDTPLQQCSNWNTGIPIGFPNRSAIGTNNLLIPPCSPSTGDMYMNFMDYTTGIFAFSAGQVVRMQNMFDYYRRTQLHLRNTNCIPPPILATNANNLCSPQNVAITITPPSGYNLNEFTVTAFVGNGNTYTSTGITLVGNVATLAINGTVNIRIILTHNSTQIQTIAVLRIYCGQLPITSRAAIDVAATNAAVVTVAGYPVYSWDYNHPPLINNDILVPSNATLNIYDKVLMPKDKRIIVNPGGKLNLYETGGLTTCTDPISNTDRLWGGIELLSSAVGTISTSSSGPVGGLEIYPPRIYNNIALILPYISYFNSYEGAYIEHAKTAITAGNSRSQNGGASVSIVGTKFLNNKLHLSFAANTLNLADHVFITGSQFTTNDNYRSPTIPPLCVKIAADKGIVFKDGNIFEDRRTTIATPALHASGILATNSNFRAERTPVGGVSNMFDNLYYGVQATRGFSNDEEVVLYLNNFVSCFRSVYVSGFTTATVGGRGGLRILQNNMEHGITYGVYLDACTKFILQNNQITDGDDGAIVLNSGIQDNEVYNNNFLKGVSSLLRGVTAWNNNRSDAGTEGLQIRCNKFAASQAHIWVKTDDTTNHAFSVRDNQGMPNGQPSKLAGNQFLAGGTGSPIFDFKNDNDFNVNYYYHGINNTGLRVVPQVYRSLYPVSVPVSFIEADACLISYANGPDNPFIASGGNLPPTIGTLWQDRTDALVQKSILQTTLHNLEDGGNTPLVENEIAMTQLQDAYTLYASLLSKSPYLSEEALQELAEKENFPPALIRDIMVANKHAGKDASVVDKLENRDNELPEYMLEQIKTAAASGASAKEILEATIAQKA
ncbi:MAG: hypothetical protein RI894_2581, partial [Bacteroidota bacterium]